jgi:flavodoxin
MSKILTVFYSRKGENHFPDGMRVIEKGNTAWAAEHIQAAVGGDLFEIEPVKPYSDNYRECVGQSVQDVKANARPEIKAFVENMDEYDTIFVGFPCWCGTAPMCVFTFLEHYDLTGKKIHPICTNEGSGMANSVAHLKASCPGAEVSEGLPFRGHLCEGGAEEIGAWAKAQL